MDPMKQVGTGMNQEKEAERESDFSPKTYQ